MPHQAALKLAPTRRTATPPAEPRGVLEVACLLALLAFIAGARVLELVVRRLRLDLWEVALYLGLAEHERPLASAPVRPAARS